MDRVLPLLMFFALSAGPFTVWAQDRSRGGLEGSSMGGYEVEIEAQPHGRKTMPSFQTIDTDNNDYLNSEEAKAVTGLQLRDADKDNDGRLSQQEFEAAVTIAPPAEADSSKSPNSGDLNPSHLSHCKTL